VFRREIRGEDVKCHLIVGFYEGGAETPYFAKASRF
jgi:hypothetical protein